MPAASPEALDRQRARKRDYMRRERAAGRRRESPSDRTPDRVAYALWRERRDGIKLASGCVDCLPGTEWPPEVLDFDHVPERGPKLFGLNNGAKRAWWKVLSEIAKCDVVCANHHRMRTKRRAL